MIVILSGAKDLRFGDLNHVRPGLNELMAQD
jgi:hypothetical protein